MQQFRFGMFAPGANYIGSELAKASVGYFTPPRPDYLEWSDRRIDSDLPPMGRVF